MSYDTIEFWAVLVLAIAPWAVVFRALIQLAVEDAPREFQGSAGAEL